MDAKAAEKECDHMAPTGWLGDQTQPARIKEGQD